jgi:hypothetical protein
VATCIKEWSTAVSGLHRRTDLKITRVVTEPGKGTYVAHCEIGASGEEPRERVAQCHDGVAGAHRATCPERSNRLRRIIDSNDRKIVFLSLATSAASF